MIHNDTLQSDYDVLDYEAGADPELKGKECSGCRRLLTYRFFDRNSSYKDGYEPLCPLCRKSPKLSMAEHVSRLREMNYKSEATNRQRHPDQHLMNTGNSGRFLEASVLLQKLLHLIPNLYVTQGGIIGDLALYVTSAFPKKEWNSRDFHYIGYVTLGLMPEYSKYEFNERDVLQRCTQIGWRSVLLRFIEAHVLTEEQCNREFGHPSGGAGSLWFKKLHDFRNAKKVA